MSKWPDKALYKESIQKYMLCPRRCTGRTFRTSCTEGLPSAAASTPTWICSATRRPHQGTVACPRRIFALFCTCLCSCCVWTSCHPAVLRSACCCMEPCLGLLHRRALLRGLMRLDSLPWAMTEHMNSEFETCPACRRKQEGWGLPQQLLSFRTVNARTSASILQRPSRDGEAAQEYADPQMQAMAQVWAHPEDLPLYPVSPFFPHLFFERRSCRI